MFSVYNSLKSGRVFAINNAWYLLAGVGSVDDEEFGIFLGFVRLFLSLVVCDDQDGSAFVVSHLKAMNQL